MNLMVYKLYCSKVVKNGGGDRKLLRKLLDTR